MLNNALPLISIITPSFNQADYIEETIRSVWSQDYPNIEHIVIDGGSNDGTVEILKNCSHLGERFRYISEPDFGQSHALNKGFQIAKGEMIGWLNSDDTYLPGAIARAVDYLKRNPAWAMVYGNAYYTDKNNKILKPYPVRSFSANRLFDFCIICQPAAFIRKQVLVALNGVDESLHFCMDYDLWIRIAKRYPIGYAEVYFANSRLHPQSKTMMHSADKSLFEIFETSFKHYGSVSNRWISGLIQNHFHKGQDWIIQFLKPYLAFGNIKEEYEFSNALQRGPKYSKNWLKKNRKCSPNF